MSHRISAVLLLAGILLGLIGGVAPWIPHQAAGLQVGGFDLFEVSKFLPAVSSGAVPLFREGFLLPVLSSAVLLALLPILSQTGSQFARWLCPAGAAIIALLALPPYPFILTAHRDPEFRGQLALAIASLLLILGSPLARRMPARALDGLAITLALVGAIPALAALTDVLPLFAELYSTPVSAGWGAVACSAGWVAVLIASIPRKQ